MTHRTILTIFSIIISINCFAQFSDQKTVDLTFEGVSTVDIQHQKGDLLVSKSPDGKAHVLAKISATASTQEKLDEGMSGLDIITKQVGANLGVSTLVDAEKCTETTESRGFFNRLFGSGNRTVTMKLNDISIDLEVQLPDVERLDVKNNYEEIRIQVPANRLIVAGFQSKVFLESTSKEAKLNLKYSELEYQDLGEADIVMFQSEADGGKLADVELNMKYSTFRADELQDLHGEMFQSKIYSKSAKDIDLNMKYSHLEDLETAGEVELLSFQSSASIDRLDKLTLNSSKYSDYRIDAVKELICEDVFQDKYRIGRADEIDATMKYTTIRCGRLEKSADISAFQGGMTVEMVSDVFEHLELEGKYFKLELPLGNRKFGIEADAKYLELDWMKDGERKSVNGSSIFTHDSMDSTVPSIELSGFQLKVDLL